MSAMKYLDGHHCICHKYYYIGMSVDCPITALLCKVIYLLLCVMEYVAILSVFLCITSADCIDRSDLHSSLLRELLSGFLDVVFLPSKLACSSLFLQIVVEIETIGPLLIIRL